MIERSPEKDVYQKLNAVSIFLIIYIGWTAQQKECSTYTWDTVRFYD